MLKKTSSGKSLNFVQLSHCLRDHHDVIQNSMNSDSEEPCLNYLCYQLATTFQQYKLRSEIHHFHQICLGFVDNNTNTHQDVPVCCSLCPPCGQRLRRLRLRQVRLRRRTVLRCSSRMHRLCCKLNYL